MKNLMFVLAIAAASAALGVWSLRLFRDKQDGTTFRTMPLESGPFLAAISATGTIEPRDAIDVGAQVAGRIDTFGIDPRSQVASTQALWADVLVRQLAPAAVLLSDAMPQKAIDYGSPVEKDTILAQLDAALYRTEVEMGNAELKFAQAELAQLSAKLKKAEDDYVRAKQLQISKAISPDEFEQARVKHEIAAAEILRGKANVERAETSLRRAEINLKYTTVRSPVKGIIIDRRVNVGQTVVASLNAPSLFLIATDLRKLQVWASVNEADIGQIQPGQEVRFSVDAFPGEVFVGYVAEDQPRLNASMTQNVVTYTVVVNTDNDSSRLIPYLTANLKFVQTQKTAALLIPNAALRWRPDADHVQSEYRELHRKLFKKIRPSPFMFGLEKDVTERYVWMLGPDGLVYPAKIQVGLSDGTMTEVIGGDLKEADMVVVGEETKPDANANPFTPSMYGGKKKMPQ